MYLFLGRPLKFSMQAALLSEALRAVAEAFVDAISKAADSAAARAPSQKATLLELSDSLCTTLERDSEAGLTWIQVRSFATRPSFGGLFCPHSEWHHFGLPSF